MHLKSLVTLISEGQHRLSVHTKVLPIYECSTEDTKSEQRQGMRRKFPEDQVGQQEKFFSQESIQM